MDPCHGGSQATTFELQNRQKTIARREETSAVELFQEGSLISKEPLSTTLTIATGDDERTIQIRHFETEDDRPFSIKVIGTFLLVATILILVIPNSQYEKIGIILCGANASLRELQSWKVI